MKLNFWQWLGVIALLIVVPYYIYTKYIAKKPPANNPASMSTQSGHQADSESEYFTTAPAQ